MTRARMLACAAMAVALSLASGTVQSEPSVLVQVVQAQKGSLPQTVTAYGSVQPDASARQAIMAPIAAVVRAVYVRQGEDVAAKQALVELAPSPAAAAAYAQAQSALRAAKQLVLHTRQLVGQQLATLQQLAEAEKSEADAQSALAALTAQGAGGPHILRAPFHAVVTGLQATPGAIVAEGAVLLDLAHREKLVLRVGVPPDGAAAVKPGDHATVTPLGRSDQLLGTVVLAGAMVEATSGLVPIDISLPKGKSLPGETAAATITTGMVSGYVIPHAAILVDEHGAPYVVQAVDLRARLVPVRVLGTQGDRDVVDGSLDIAAPLVVAGNHQLESGMTVRISGQDGTAPP